MSFGAVDTSERSGNGRGFTGPRLPAPNERSSGTLVPDRVSTAGGQAVRTGRASIARPVNTPNAPYSRPSPLISAGTPIISC